MTTGSASRDEFHASGGVGPSRCPACGGSAGREIEQGLLRDQHLKYSNHDEAGAARLDQAYGSACNAYRVIRCEGCGLEFAQPLVDPTEHWYQELYGQLQLYPSERWEFTMVAGAVDSADVIVDYGCGSGEFLMTMRDRAARAVGFDFSTDAVQSATRKGLEAHRIGPQGEPAEMIDPVRADHVVAFHVLEHLERPATLFQFANQVSGPAAKLWVAVPSNRRASRVYGEPDALDSPPHHLSRWTPSALEAIGRSEGWAMVRHVYEPLSVGLAVWEETRRLPLYGRLHSRWRTMERIARRGLAAGVWMSRRHRQADASGFSMLACYQRSVPT